MTPESSSCFTCEEIPNQRRGAIVLPVISDRPKRPPAAAVILVLVGRTSTVRTGGSLRCCAGLEWRRSKPEPSVQTPWSLQAQLLSDCCRLRHLRTCRSFRTRRRTGALIPGVRRSLGSGGIRVTTLNTSDLILSWKLGRVVPGSWQETPWEYRCCKRFSQPFKINRGRWCFCSSEIRTF